MCAEILVRCAQSRLSRLVNDKVIFAYLQVASRCNLVEHHCTCWWRGFVARVVGLFGVVWFVGFVRIVGLVVSVRNHIVGIVECRVRLRSPHILFKSGIVHIGVSVHLQLIYSLVSIHFFLAYGVFPRPTNEHVQSPFCQSGVAAVAVNAAAPSANLVFVARGHIEISPG